LLLRLFEGSGDELCISEKLTLTYQGLSTVMQWNKPEAFNDGALMTKREMTSLAKGKRYLRTPPFPSNL
jgi:hypothetical protein